MAGEAMYYGTGRRKNAVARVRIVPGTGKVTVNGREGVEFFGRQALVDYATTPFVVTDTQGHFDVIARCNGGGVSGQAGALRHGIARALLEAGDYRAELKKAGYLTRDSRMVERKKYGLKKARKHGNLLAQKQTLVALRTQALLFRGFQHGASFFVSSFSTRFLTCLSTLRSGCFAFSPTWLTGRRLAFAGWGIWT